MTAGVIRAASSADARSWRGRSISSLGKSRSKRSGTGAGANMARIPPGSRSRESGGEMGVAQRIPNHRNGVGRAQDDVHPGGREVVAREQDKTAHEGRRL